MDKIRIGSRTLKYFKLIVNIMNIILWENYFKNYIKCPRKAFRAQKELNKFSIKQSRWLNLVELACSS
jgi:hypothetical protein